MSVTVGVRGLWAVVSVLATILLPPAVTAAPVQSPLVVTGASYFEVDDRTGIWQMRGDPVVVTRGSRTVRAPSMTFDSHRHVLTAAGPVSVHDDMADLDAATVVVFLEEERLLAEGGVSAVVQDPASPAHLQADRLEVLSVQQRALATGGVRLLRGEFVLYSSELAYDFQMHYALATGRPRVVSPQATLSADRIGAQVDREELSAEGGAHLIADEFEGTAPTMVWQSAVHVATLSGGATIRRRYDELRAEVITIDLEAKRVVATGGAHVVVFPNP